MDKNSLVKDLLDGGQDLIEELRRRGLEITTAIWLRTSDDDQKWYFYIVSPTVDTEGYGEAYIRLHPLRVEIEDRFGINPNRITLMGPSNPFAQDLLTKSSRIPGPRRSPYRWPGIWLGNKSIEEAYVYPVPAAAT